MSTPDTSSLPELILAVNDQPSPPKSTSASSHQKEETTIPADTKSTSASILALHYDHGTTPNTGNVPPISKWVHILIGKRWITETAEGGVNAFKRSELPRPNRVNGFINDGMRQRDRLNVDCDRKTGIVRWVKYG